MVSFNNSNCSKIISSSLLAIIAKYGFPISEWAVLLYKGVYEQNSTMHSVLVDDWPAGGRSLLVIPKNLILYIHTYIHNQ